jgi:hypothetical protein
MEINKPWLQLRVTPRRRGAAPLGFFLALPMVALPFGGWLLESGRLTLAQCTFKSLLGIPCMGCGATRATLNLMHGDLAEALSFSPMMTLLYGLLLLWGPWSLWMYSRDKELHLELAPWLAWTVRVALIATPFLNWGYLIARDI